VVVFDSEGFEGVVGGAGLCAPTGFREIEARLSPNSIPKPGVL
jgi:hypothetical protein